ncbi:uracil-DNA glycosylase [Pseudidiomarina sp. GXY010]|uniref:Uracil-DNA glycosylase n=1 Tax=Pseudidiomarina fusca TaxID=2965078 RepID=A0ABU3KXA9_9GAMM|nr:uracil-DNA glycosylase [Pseudidiomarina sp. GXY010]MDT7526133.1 uracil-DNA glycosylase [Pseudidiomarina sp. GXY010]
MQLTLDNDWQPWLAQQQQQAYWPPLQQRVQAARQQNLVYPPAAQVLRAFELTPLSQVQVVIIGQDPYHGPGQAHGLAFSVADGVAIPPSLRNIYKAIKHDFADYQIPTSGNLEGWAKRGILLLNTVLTVEHGKAHSHAKWGWENFTDAAIQAVSAQREGVVFMLWGAHAQKKAALIDDSRHTILQTVHPSPLSAHRGFFTAGHFATTAKLLNRSGAELFA